MFDPTGPGTPAWEAFDEALAAKASGNARRYDNQRMKMKQHLRKHNTSLDVIDQWCQLLRKRITDQEWE